MPENVTASTATRADTVFILNSIIEKNLLIPWFSILFVLWIWKRFNRSRYSNWAWEEILARIGNPADVIPLQPHPSGAEDRPIFTSYSHLCTELSIRMNETPMNKPCVLHLGFYFFIVEATVFTRVFCLVNIFRNCTILFSLVLVICCCIHLGIPLIASPDDEVMVQLYKNMFLLTCDIGISIFRIQSPERIFPHSLSQLALQNLPLLFIRPLLNVPLVDWAIRQAVTGLVFLF